MILQQLQQAIEVAAPTRSQEGRQLGPGPLGLPNQVGGPHTLGFLKASELGSHLSASAILGQPIPFNAGFLHLKKWQSPLGMTVT